MPIRGSSGVLGGKLYRSAGSSHAGIAPSAAGDGSECHRSRRRPTELAYSVGVGSSAAALPRASAKGDAPTKIGKNRFMYMYSFWVKLGKVAWTEGSGLFLLVEPGDAGPSSDGLGRAVVPETVRTSGR